MTIKINSFGDIAKGDWVFYVADSMMRKSPCQFRWHLVERVTNARETTIKIEGYNTWLSQARAGRPREHGGTRQRFPRAQRPALRINQPGRDSPSFRRIA